MDPNGRTPEHEEARQRLLEEGARSYLDAVTTLVEYEREVQNKCREIMKKQLNAYASALGVELGEENIKGHSYPERKQWDGTQATLGVKIVHKVENLGVSWWESYCCISWEYTDAASLWFGPWVGVGLPKRVAVALQAQLPFAGTVLQDHTVWLGQELEPHKAADFETILEELLGRWIDAWRQVRGFKEFLSSSRSQSLGEE